MNSLIKSIFADFKVGGKKIPVSFLRYSGTAKAYVTYQEITKGNGFYSDNELRNYISYYDFDVFSKSDYLPIIEGIKTLLISNGFKWQPELTSADMFEDDTGYYHKTLNFSYIRSEDSNIIPSI